MHTIVGIVLAAGEGRRMGKPKALLELPGGPTYVEATCQTLFQAGCPWVVVVVGAQGARVRRVLEASPIAAVPGRKLTTIDNPEWDQGVSTSLKHALTHVTSDGYPLAVAALIHLVDLPDVTTEVITRVIDQGPITPAVLRRASYHGRPGHPVLLGADHWAPAVEQAHGDGGARHYMAAQAPTEVEVGDLATGDDVDTPQQRRRFETRWLG